jgi:hypothetical protein
MEELSRCVKSTNVAMERAQLMRARWCPQLKKRCRQVFSVGPRRGCDICATWFVPRLYKGASLKDSQRVKAGSNTSTVTLRVVRGEEKRSLKSETVKYGHEYQVTRTRERIPGEGQQHIQKTDPFSRQRGRPQKHDRNCQRVMNIWSWAPDGARRQDSLIDWSSVAMWLTLDSQN